MERSLILVANARRARCFERHAANAQLTELRAFIHPQSRHAGPPPDGDLSGDAGKGHGRTAHSGTQFEPRTPLRTSERRAFARELAAYVNGEVDSHRWDRLALIASGPMLGELLPGLSVSARRILKASVTGDLTRYQGRELAERIDSSLAPPG